MTTLVNIPYETLKIGQCATYTRTLTERDLVLFATVSGDHNPIHLNEEYVDGIADLRRFGDGATWTWWHLS